MDSFHTFDKAQLLNQFEEDYVRAVRNGISMNPVLNAFQLTVKKYGIEQRYVDEFLRSMRADLEKKTYESKLEIDGYIRGSADVVGLMCLKVFCNNNQPLFDSLIVPATRLGSAFQKVNFLRDIKEDTQTLGRIYFPQLTQKELDETTKQELVADIQHDFDEAYKGIQQLPRNSRLAVMVAYKYYVALLDKIKKTPANELMNKRVRVSDFKKTVLLSTAYVKHKLNLS